MQFPILNGIYTDEAGEFRVQFPRNLVPVVLDNGLAAGFLRPAEGLALRGTGPGFDRGGINWNGRHFRVMGSKLIEIDVFGAVTTIGDVEDNGKPVSFDYSFDYLAVASNKKLWLYNGTLAQVTDPDLRDCLDVVWVDGYFMSTDGESLVVGELNDPFDIGTLRYASSEVDPDPVEAVLKLRNEVYAVNRYTIEVFQNIGGTGFPFQRINGGQIRRGAVGTHACCVFEDEFIAFVGGGRNEAPAVWIGANGSSKKVSTREVDKLLAGIGEAGLKDIVLEERTDKGHKFLLIHLPGQTLVYDFDASQVAQTPVWHTLSSAVSGDGVYRARNFVYVFDRWHFGDPTSFNFGYLDDESGHHYGQKVGWDFSTKVLYNEAKGLIVQQLELVGITGRTEVGVDPEISCRYTQDGRSWSQPRYISSGKTGETRKRLVWFRQGAFRNYRGFRFTGDSSARLTFARLELEGEPLMYG